MDFKREIAKLIKIDGVSEEEVFSALSPFLIYPANKIKSLSSTCLASKILSCARLVTTIDTAMENCGNIYDSHVPQ